MVNIVTHKELGIALSNRHSTNMGTFLYPVAVAPRNVSHLNMCAEYVFDVT